MYIAKCYEVATPQLICTSRSGIPPEVQHFKRYMYVNALPSHHCLVISVFLASCAMAVLQQPPLKGAFLPAGFDHKTTDNVGL